jgi:hypothetical protein
MNYSPKATQRVEDINMRGGRLDVRKKNTAISSSYMSITMGQFAGG